MFPVMKRRSLVVVFGLLMPGVFGAAALSADLELARHSKPSMAIVIPDDATEQDKNAAGELKAYLDRITGGQFLIVAEAGTKPAAKCIYVGATKTLATAWPALKLDSLGKDGIVLKVSPAGDLFIAGRAPRGTLYAVYSFLEDFCGVRWWTPTCESVPSNPSLTTRAAELEYSPVMDYRDSFYFSFNGMEKVYADDVRTKFCVKMKNNGFFNGIPAQWGGNTTCLSGAWPTFAKLIPPERYFKDHPEWFSELNGQRTTKQLCLSNLEMRQEMARNLLAMIQATPGVDMVTITQNDTDGACQCAQCRAIDANEGSPAGLLLQCVNAVAEEVEKQYPNLYVNTLAYAYNLKEPKITKPRKNVSVQICCTAEAGRYDSPRNAAFMNTLRMWTGMTRKTYAWTYLVDFGDMLDPIPNTFDLGPNIQALAKHKVAGVFAQGNSYCPIGDFPELKAWLVAKMLWNPALDDQSLINEFVNAYYGEAAQPLHQYLELIGDAGAAHTMAIAWHNAYASPPALTPWLSLETMNQATRLFDEAEKLAADNAEQLDRVKRARAAIEFQWLIGWKEYRHQSQEQGRPFLGPKDQHEAYEQFMADCRKWKVSRLCEGSGSLNVLHPAIFGK
jgi:hypothetical protein